MAGKINRRVKSGKPVLVNGYWEHPSLDNRPPSPKLLAHMVATAHRLKLTSL